MKLTLIRDTFTPQSTTGRLYVDGVFECFVLEDTERHGQPKIYSKTAIPRGTYQIQITQSARFKRLLPLLMSVPNFEGIRIHPGNTSADTEGCLLPGKARKENAVLSSRMAFNALYAKLWKAWKASEPINIDVIVESNQSPTTGAINEKP